MASNIWLTSDTHFSHFNIIKYTNRPFSTIEEMNEALIKNWNEKVKANDIVYHLGDVAFSSASSVINIMRRLNGTKRLTVGNHDKKNLKDPTFYSCFEQIKEYYELNYNKRRFILFHYPIESWNGKNHWSIHCCGHGHLKKDSRENILRMDVGVDNDMCGYSPINIDTVLGIMEKRKQKIRQEMRDKEQ